MISLNELVISIVSVLSKIDYSKDYKETFGKVSPKFKVASFNDVKPDDQKITLTAAWERDKVLVDGYVDFAFNSDTLENNIHFNPQVKYNLQEALGIDNRLEVGGEYSYWKNKFGVDGVDEHAVMALVKYHF